MQAASQTAEISYREYTITEVISELADVVEAQLEAARSLDANRLLRLRRVTLPLLTPAIVGAVIDKIDDS